MSTRPCHTYLNLTRRYVMARRSDIHFQQGVSLFDFQLQFGSENQCRDCRHQASLLTGAIFSSTKLPLTTWFLATYLVSQSKGDCSSLKLRRFIGICQTAAMRLKHKLQVVMKLADDKRPLRGYVQIYWGGKRPGSKRGRGAEGKTPFVAAL